MKQGRVKGEGEQETKVNKIGKGENEARERKGEEGNGTKKVKGRN